MTGWNFHKTPDDPRFDWVASGNLPTLIKDGCVGRAVMSAGGEKQDGCGA